MPPQERLRLDNEEGLLPGAYHPGQKHQEHPICFGTGRTFHLSAQNDELLTQERVFCHELGLAPGKVGQRSQQERGSVRCGSSDEALVERLKTNACQAPHVGENPLHSVHSPFVKMSRCMLEMVLLLWGIGKEQKL